MDTLRQCFIILKDNQDKLSKHRLLKILNQNT